MVAKLKTHHGNESYEEANSKAAKVAREKLENIIEQGKSKALSVIDSVQNTIVHDQIVRSNRLEFKVDTDAEGEPIIMNVQGNKTRLHKHAFKQVMNVAEIPANYVDILESKGEAGSQLAVHNLNQLFSWMPSERANLIRSVGEETRGFLSDRFRRIDSRPLLEAFCTACQSKGILPLEGFAMDTKVKLRAVLPVIFEPIDNEVMVFGVEWGNSDYGDGGHFVKTWVMRCWCTNLAMAEELLRQIHLGKRLDDNIQYSDRTYQLDTKANASALIDVIEHALSPQIIHGYLQCVKDAAEDLVSVKDARNIFKKHLYKEEARLAEDAFTSPDVLNLPPGDNTYRLSNAVSWIAQNKNISQERKLELQDIAGNLLPKPKNKSKLVEV